VGVDQTVSRADCPRLLCGPVGVTGESEAAELVALREVDVQLRGLPAIGGRPLRSSLPARVARSGSEIITWLVAAWHQRMRVSVTGLTEDDVLAMDEVTVLDLDMDGLYSDRPDRMNALWLRG
jgi:hypothetical protein